MQPQHTIDDEHSQPVLPADTQLLLGQYRIERFLVQGGFGVTYLAIDSLDRRVVIKECFPEAICTRDGNHVVPSQATHQSHYLSIRSHFLREAHRMARLDHPNILGVHQVFEENNTAYMAIDFINGMDLQSVIEWDRGRLTPRLLQSMLTTCLNALQYVHAQGILHRDISPDNFMLRDDDEVMLIDFGCATDPARDDDAKDSALLAVKDGYSPPEFYTHSGTHTQASDLYSLGATFYHMITGHPPPQSQSRKHVFAASGSDPYRQLTENHSGFDDAFLAAIDQALQLEPENRIQTPGEWLAYLQGMKRVKTKSTVSPVLTGQVNDKISKLVAEVNNEVAQIEDAIARTLTKPTPTNDADENRQLVDIYGDPVEDIEAWMQEQNRMIELRERQARRTPPADQHDWSRLGWMERLLLMRRGSARVAKH